MALITTARKPDSVSRCLKAAFTGADDVNLIVWYVKTICDMIYYQVE
jgi:hypothetical protein